MSVWDRRKQFQKQRSAKISVENYTREDDLTFSFGRPVECAEVLNLLARSGCFEAEDYLSAIKMLRITKRLNNGQVFVTTSQKGVADLWADRVNTFAGLGIKKCHTYTSKEVLVHFGAIHPSVDVEKEIVAAFLRKYHGRVKDYFPQLIKNFDIPTGAWTFVMFEEDLKINPIPECVYIGNVPCYVSYRTQEAYCFKCGKDGHKAFECEVKEDFPILGGTPDKASQVFMDGVIPRRVVKKPVVNELVTHKPADKDGVVQNPAVKPVGNEHSTTEEVEVLPEETDEIEIQEKNDDKKEEIPPVTATSSKFPKKFDNGKRATASSKLRDGNELPVLTEGDDKSKKRPLEGGEEGSSIAKIPAVREDDMDSWPNASDDDDPEKRINHWNEDTEDMDNLDLNDVDKSELNLGGTEEVITSPLDPSNAINTG